MSLCSDCNQPLTHEPMEQHAPGGDWFYACNICEWHSEDERPHTAIRKSLSPLEIVHLKLKLDSALAYSISHAPIMSEALKSITTLLLKEEELQ